ncbi:MAG: hypothetical protein WC412_07445 [Candidatus Omnitrophota bacterium]|jgi:hypothetical protein
MNPALPKQNTYSCKNLERLRQKDNLLKKDVLKKEELDERVR